MDIGLLIFGGRNLLDHFIDALPRFLTDYGVVYLMQVSLVGQYRTAALLEEKGFKSHVVDFNLYEFSPVFMENLEQIQRVGELSDAYHFRFGRQHMMVIYLLEVTRQ